MKKVLLHVCCGVCALSCIKRLKEEGFEVDTFFFNPNIHPEKEYLKRRHTAKIVSDTLDVKMAEGGYDIESWSAICGKYKDEKEGGKRCSACIKYRLKETFALASSKYDYFAASLTISPHKLSSAIIEIGKSIAQDKFLPLDFKKKDGFKKSMEAAKELNLYRQNYCGCIYSAWSGHCV